MTLQRFLNAVGDSRWTWLGRSRCKPRPEDPFTLLNVLAQAAATGITGVVAGAVLSLLLRANPRMAGGTWPLVWCGTFGLVVGLVACSMIAVAWNRRSWRLVAEGRTEPPELPPARVWQWLIVGPLYAAVFFLVTPAFLWVSVDNAMGTIAWQRARAAMVARGEPLTMAQLQGPPPADAENFAMSPLIRSAWDYQVGVTNGRSEPVWADPVGKARLQLLGVPQSFRPSENANAKPMLREGRIRLDWIARSIRSEPRERPAGMPDDLAKRYGLVDKKPASMSEQEILALPVTDPAQEVLDFLRRFEPELVEVSDAARRPHSRFGTRFEEGMSLYLPYLGTMKSLTLTFRLRAAARLAKGDVDGAFADTLTTFRLAEATAEDPVLLTFLVRIAQYAIATSTAWQGLVDHRWTEPQLVELQGIFERADFREDLSRAFQGERIFGNAIYDSWLGLGTGAALAAVDISPEMVSTEMPALPRFAPRGMFRRNQVNQHRMFDAILAQLRDPAWPKIAGLAASDQEYDARYLARLGLTPTTPYNILPAMLAPAFSRAQAKAVRVNVVARMGEAVCALERHRLRHGSYPGQLDELVPAFLKSVPLDPMSAEPLRYRRTDDGWFALWSVGLNGRDDGGVVKDNDRQGDWVWPSPVPSKDLRLF